MNPVRALKGLVFAGFAGFATPEAHAALVTYQLTGTITGISVFDDPAPNGNFNVAPVLSTSGTGYPLTAAIGDAFSVTYSFDPSTPDSTPNTTTAANYTDALTAVTWAISETGSTWDSPLANADFNDLAVYGNFACGGCYPEVGYGLLLGGRSTSVGGAFGSFGLYEYGTQVLLSQSVGENGLSQLVTSRSLSQLPNPVFANYNSISLFVDEATAPDTFEGGAGIFGTVATVTCTAGCDTIRIPASGWLLLSGLGAIAVAPKIYRKTS